MNLIETGAWLPLVFAGLIVLSMLIYAILDGYDLGVGIWMHDAQPLEKDQMIASIGPFWDANETWLVLGIGLLLVAFPQAYSILLKTLYIPFTVMIISLIVRGVAFDFRSKAKVDHQKAWNRAFCLGSLCMALSQGYILGAYILGFQTGWLATAFSVGVGCSVAAAYSLMGATWLMMKAEGTLQQKSVAWARTSLLLTAMGILMISIATPFLSARIFDQWFAFPQILLLAPMLFISLALLVALECFLRQWTVATERFCWVPFVTTVGLFILCFHGLAYSFYPYIIPGQLKIVDTSTSQEALKVMFIGAAIVLPILIAYTFFAYKVFHGKTRELRYD